MSNANEVVVAGVTMTRAAARNVEECGFDPAIDVEAARAGHETYDSLLDLCLRGAEQDRHQGWVDYVDAIFEHIG